MQVMKMLEPQLFIANVDRAMRRQELNTVANGCEGYWAWKNDNVRLVVSFENDAVCWCFYFVLGDDLFENGYFLTRSGFGGKQPITRGTITEIVDVYRQLLEKVLV